MFLAPAAATALRCANQTTRYALATPGQASRSVTRSESPWRVLARFLSDVLPGIWPTWSVGAALTLTGVCVCRQVDGALLIFSVLLIIMNVLELRSAYCMLLWVVPLSAFKLVAAILAPHGKEPGEDSASTTLACCSLFFALCVVRRSLYNSPRRRRRLSAPSSLQKCLPARCHTTQNSQSVDVRLPSQLGPAIYWLQVARTVLVIFLPVMGRSGMLLRPDIFIGALFGLLTGLVSMAPLALARAAADAGTSE